MGRQDARDADTERIWHQGDMRGLLAQHDGLAVCRVDFVFCGLDTAGPGYLTQGLQVLPCLSNWSDGPCDGIAGNCVMAGVC